MIHLIWRANQVFKSLLLSNTISFPILIYTLKMIGNCRCFDIYLYLQFTVDINLIIIAIIDNHMYTCVHTCTCLVLD